MSTIEKTFSNGEVIIKEGDSGNSFFQILEGTATVYKNYGKDDQVKLTVLTPGQYFGEMAVIETYPRSSTVVADGEVKVVEIPGEDLNTYYRENPDEIVSIMKHLGNRLKQLTADYNEAKGLFTDIEKGAVEKKSDSILTKLPVILHCLQHDSVGEIFIRIGHHTTSRSALTASISAVCVISFLDSAFTILSSMVPLVIMC